MKGEKEKGRNLESSSSPGGKKIHVSAYPPMKSRNWERLRINKKGEEKKRKGRDEIMSSIPASPERRKGEKGKKGRLRRPLDVGKQSTKNGHNEKKKGKKPLWTTKSRGGGKKEEKRTCPVPGLRDVKNAFQTKKEKKRGGGRKRRAFIFHMQKKKGGEKKKEKKSFWLFRIFIGMVGKIRKKREGGKGFRSFLAREKKKYASFPSRVENGGTEKSREQGKKKRKEKETPPLPVKWQKRGEKKRGGKRKNLRRQQLKESPFWERGGGRREKGGKGPVTRLFFLDKKGGEGKKEVFRRVMGVGG